MRGNVPVTMQIGWHRLVAMDSLCFISDSVDVDNDVNDDSVKCRYAKLLTINVISQLPLFLRF